jgi:transcriptional regulator with XRE-family HTH domain
MNIGFNIRKKREDKKYSQEYLASLLNISQQNLCDIENNKTKINTDKLEKIAKALDTDINELIKTETSHTFNNFDKVDSNIKHIYSNIEAELKYVEKLLEAKDDIIKAKDKLIEQLSEKINTLNNKKD